MPHARLHITGHGGANAGARAAAVMPSATLRRTGAARAADPLFGGCTLHVPSARRPLTACQELPPTAAATPHLHALVAVPPLPRVPARAPAARRLAIAEQCLLLSGLGSELGAGFRAGGRAVNLGCKRLLSKEKNRNLPCALEAWTSEDRCVSRDDVSCARTAEAGVIPGRHCGESRLASSRALVGRCTCIHRTRDFDARFV